MKPILEAEIVTPDNLDISTINNYDLIGFASGVYKMKPDSGLLKLVEKIPFQKRGKAFTLTTSGSGKKYQKNLNTSLEKKGFEIVGEFTSKGWTTFFILALFGGVNKGRPNENDLERARQFAREVQSRFS
jgi:hypothetical protein